MLSERPWHPEAVLRLGCGILACLSLGMLVLAVLTPPLRHLPLADQQLVQFLLGTLSFQGAAIGLIALFLREMHVSWSAAFGLAAPGLGRALALAGLFALAIVTGALALGALSGDLMLRGGLKPEPQTAVQMMQNTVSWKRQLLYGVIVAFPVPVAEEMMFRGILYPTIKQMGYPRLALWGTCVLFGAIHLNLMALVPLTYVALMLTLLYEKTDNLLAPMAAHTLFNAINFALLYDAFDLSRWVQ